MPPFRGSADSRLGCRPRMLEVLHLPSGLGTSQSSNFWDNFIYFQGAWKWGKKSRGVKQLYCETNGLVALIRDFLVYPRKSWRTGWGEGRLGYLIQTWMDVVQLERHRHQRKGQGVARIIGDHSLMTTKNIHAKVQGNLTCGC